MEEWKFVRNSECYMISNYGRIKSLNCKIIRSDGKPYTIKGKILKPYKVKSQYGDTSYEIIHLKLDVNKHKLIHRMVMEAFNSVKNMNNLDVNHKDGNKSNNKLENLEWCTKKENMKHAKESGLWSPQNRCGEGHPLSRLTEKDVLKIREILKNKEMKQCEIAKLYGISDGQVSDIKNRKKWKNI